MDDNLAFYLDVEDPEDTGVIKQAYCVLTEVHANFKTKTLLAIFECWRNRAACFADKNSFTAIQIPLEPDQGGKLYFTQHGLDGAQMHLAPSVRNFVLEHAPQLQTATPADKKE